MERPGGGLGRVKAIGELSLGWRTELIFARFDAQVIERPGYLLVRTPHNPTFYWGNYLLFDRPPRAGDAALWLATFNGEITQHQPESTHLAWGVDTAAPFELPPDFAALGVSMFPSTVLTLRRGQLREPRRALAPPFSVRALRLPEEAALAVELQVASDAQGYEPVGYRIFRERQMQRYGRMAAARLGHWFGVFVDTAQGEQLVADCGLFRDGPGSGARARRRAAPSRAAPLGGSERSELGAGGLARCRAAPSRAAPLGGSERSELGAGGLARRRAAPNRAAPLGGSERRGLGAVSIGRFQFVSTHPAWRRQGLCSALIHAVCRHGFDAMALDSLVIVADPDDVAIGLYEGLGFERDHTLWYLERRPSVAAETR